MMMIHSYTESICTTSFRNLFSL